MRIDKRYPPDKPVIFKKKRVLKEKIDMNHTSGTLQITLDIITGIVCEEFKITKEQVFSKTREREICIPRQLIMYFARKVKIGGKEKYSLKTIGRYLGNRDHTTVIHGCELVDDLRGNDFEFREKVDELSIKIFCPELEVQKLEEEKREMISNWEAVKRSQNEF